MLYLPRPLNVCWNACRLKDKGTYRVKVYKQTDRPTDRQTIRQIITLPGIVMLLDYQWVTLRLVFQSPESLIKEAINLGRDLRMPLTLIWINSIIRHFKYIWWTWIQDEETWYDNYMTKTRKNAFQIWDGVSKKRHMTEEENCQNNAQKCTEIEVERHEN